MSTQVEDPDAPRRRKGGRERMGTVVQVRRLHRRDLNKVWEFLKRSFRDVNLETVEYQRPRSKKRFYETYEEEGVEQLLFVVENEIVAYTECTYEILGSDTWINPRYFEKRDMRPLFVEELAVHPDWHGRGVGSFVLEQIQHLAKVRGLTHLVLEVAENNTHAVLWYRKRGFRKLDAAVFMAYAVDVAPELLPPRALEGSLGAGADDSLVLALPTDAEPDVAAGAGVGSTPASGAAPRGRRRAAKPASAKRAGGKPASAKRAGGRPASAKPASAKPASVKGAGPGAAPAGGGGASPPAADAGGDAKSAESRAAEAKLDVSNGQRRARADTVPPPPPDPRRRPS